MCLIDLKKKKKKKETIAQTRATKTFLATDARKYEKKNRDYISELRPFPETKTLPFPNETNYEHFGNNARTFACTFALPYNLHLFGIFLTM